MNRSALAGPEGHPFHPFVVPVPIGAFVSSLIFDILTWTRADGLPYLVDGAFWLIGVGLIGALVAAVFGVLDLRAIPRRTPAVASRVAFDVNAASSRPVRYRVRVAGRRSRGTGQDAVGPARVERGRRGVPHCRDWLGGKLTYHHGMRVTRQADHGKGITRCA